MARKKEKNLESKKVIDDFLKAKGWSMNDLSEEIQTGLTDNEAIPLVDWSKDTVNNLKYFRGMFKDYPYITDMVRAGVIKKDDEWHQKFLKAIELDNQKEILEPEPIVVNRIEELPPTTYNPPEQPSTSTTPKIVSEVIAEEQLPHPPNTTSYKEQESKTFGHNMRNALVITGYIIVSFFIIVIFIRSINASEQSDQFLVPVVLFALVVGLMGIIRAMVK